MSLTSYRAAPPRGGVWACVACAGARGVGCWASTWRVCGVAVVGCGGLGGPGGGRLSRSLWRSIMGAGGFHGRVRDGIGWVTVRQGHQVGQALPAAARCCQHAGIGALRDRRGWGVCVRMVVGAWERPALAGLDGYPGTPGWAHLGAGREADAALLLHPRVRRAYWAIRTAQLSALPRVHLRPIDVVVDHGPRGDLVLRRVSRLDAFSGYPGRTWLPGGAAGATTGAPEVRPPRSSRTGGSASQVSNTHGR